jgi:hypothetical protein
MDRSTHVTHDDMVCVRGMRNFGSALGALRLLLGGNSSPAASLLHSDGRGVGHGTEPTWDGARARVSGRAVA